ncbi:DUF1542 domain-containing protein [Clostridium perfringens]|nr:DUF1542 domain-containing protein [Clostridium perfringens]MDK0712608.1 DUF1542 domain-containing protein [Clostridium perfringens]
MKMKKRDNSKKKSASIIGATVLISQGVVLPNTIVSAAQQNYIGSILNYDLAKSVEPFKEYFDQKYTGSLYFNNNESVSYALQFQDANNNTFSVKKSNKDKTSYFYNGYYGEWSDRVKADGKIEMYTVKGGFYNGKWFDVKTTVYYDQEGYILMSGRDFLSVPSKMAHIKYEFFEYNDNEDEIKTLDKISESKDINLWNDFLKSKKSFYVTGSLGLYDFDNTKKTMTFKKSDIDNIFYSNTQKNGTENQAMTINDNDGMVKITSANSISNRNSNNVNNMITITFSNKNSLDVISTGSAVAETVGYTKQTLLFEPLSDYLVSTENNILNIYQYVPSRYNQFNVNFMPQGNPIPFNKFEEEVILPKLSILSTSLEGDSPFTLDSTDIGDKTHLKIYPKNMNDKLLYGKNYNLKVNFQSNISSEDLKKNADLKNELLKYYDKDTNSLKIPLEFKFNYDGISKTLNSNVKDITVNLNKDIEDYLNSEKLKEKSKGDIDNKANAAKDEINKLPNLTPEEKEKFNKEIDNQANKAKEDIDNSNTPEEIDNSTKAGEKAIDDVVNNAKDQDAKNKQAKDLQDAKDAAKEELANKAENTKNAIDKLNGVDDKVKEEAKAKVDEAKAKSDQAIDNSNTIPDVDKALADGKQAIDDIYNGIDKTSQENINNAKEKSKGDIDNKANAAKDEINKLPNLTPEEKEKFNKEIDNQANKAKEDIDNSNTPKEIDNSTKAGEKAIDDVVNNAKDQDAKNKQANKKSNNINNNNKSNTSGEKSFLPKVSLKENVKTGDSSSIPYFMGLLGSLGLLGLFKSKGRKNK